MGIRAKLGALALALLLAVSLGAAGFVHHIDVRQERVLESQQRVARPNVIFFLTDDLDKKLMPYMPHVRHLIEDRGVSFDRYYVEQSTCCTSRATTLSGQYVHNHGVHGNHYPEGGFFAWRGRGETRALPLWLQNAGYRTGLLGKYLNEYPYPAFVNATPGERAEMRRYVPPGWDSWQSPVGGKPYNGFGYRMNTNGRQDKDAQPEFIDAEMGQRLQELIGGLDGMDFREGGKFLYYASYAPHEPYAHPKVLDRRFKNVHYPHVPSFNEADVSDKLGLSALLQPLTPRRIKEIDEAFRDRIRSVQVLDHTVARVVAELRRQGTLDNTYLMFTSDNGYQMGEHRLGDSKYNQFQETVSVPFLVAGPGIPAGRHISELAGNIDLAPTIADMANATVPYATDGVSLLPLMTGQVHHLRRDYLLIGRGLIPLEKEALDATSEFPEPYVESPAHARLTNFDGVVSQRYKYIDYTHGTREELYDLRRDPYELNNLLPHGPASFRAMSPALQHTVGQLRGALKHLSTCQGATCRLPAPRH